MIMCVVWCAQHAAKLLSERAPGLDVFIEVGLAELDMCVWYMSLAWICVADYILHYE